MPEKNNMSAGVVGLGLMGSALVDALLAQNHNVTVWNRTTAKCKGFGDAGAQIADSAADAAKRSDVLIACITDYQAIEETVMTGEVADGLRNKILLQLSTVSADESRRTAEWAESNNISYLDGAILGFPENVRTNNCMIVCSGPRKLFDSCHSVLDAMGGMPRHVGETAGMAVSFERACHSASFTHWVALFHGAAMCRAAGSPLEVYIEAFTKYWDWSIPDSVYLEMVRNRDYSVKEATLETFAAAYSHVLALSEELGVNTSLPKVVSECFESALNQGYGESEIVNRAEFTGGSNS